MGLKISTNENKKKEKINYQILFYPIQEQHFSRSREMRSIVFEILRERLD